MSTNRLEDYLELLIIRQAARRRDMVISGGIFLVAFISFIAVGLLGGLAGRSVYLVGALVVVFGIVSLTAWVRLEVISGSIQLIENMGRTEAPTPL